MGSTATKKDAASDEEACMYALQLATSSILPMTLKNAIELGMLETIVSADGKALSPSEVAAQLPCKANPDAPAMVDRMLRLLASHKVVTCHMEKGEDGLLTRRYSPAPVCKWLTPNEDGVSMAPMLLMVQDKVLMDCWYYLKDSAVDGGLPFNKAHGTTVFEYQGKDTRFNSVFNEGMKGHSSIIIKKLLELYMGFEDISTIVDVGGGVGTTIHAITSKYPHIRGINFDLPHVIAEAFQSLHVQHIGGDMFEKVPPGDTIIMKGILHDWNDEHCMTLLRNCYDALPTQGKVVVVECILPVSPEAKLGEQVVLNVDMIMLAHTPSGKERYLNEFEELAMGAGFSRVNTTYIYAESWAIEFIK
ncbi:caffeic acid-O-methyltransferase [Hordeum vulgare]|uniref:Uncharacterized protein n=1 Tax=Hordeum vulgare subsp. vulgare TaxID=112509 RepID=A0A8I6WF46_HORVV|nr:flavone O-methyltransferase 1-like [Hordeum vulgare subsp. vulgare]KAE8806882.1 caffeic acid-O-methyltransferase [Hordeum vulgare]